jgi:hypothetical protein
MAREAPANQTDVARPRDLSTAGPGLREEVVNTESVCDHASRSVDLGDYSVCDELAQTEKRRRKESCIVEANDEGEKICFRQMGLQEG